MVTLANMVFVVMVSFILSVVAAAGISESLDAFIYSFIYFILVGVICVYALGNPDTIAQLFYKLFDTFVHLFEL